MKDKMLAGELYLPEDPDLVADKERCSRLVQQYNATNVTEADLRAHLLEQLLGGIGQQTEIRAPSTSTTGARRPSGIARSSTRAR